MAKGFRLRRGLSSDSSHSTDRLSKEAKGKGIAYSVGEVSKGNFWLSPLKDYDLDHIERDEILDMLSDGFSCDLAAASQVAKARVAVKTKLCEFFDLDNESWEEVQNDLDHYVSEDMEAVPTACVCPS